MKLLFDKDRQKSFFDQLQSLKYNEIFTWESARFSFGIFLLFVLLKQNVFLHFFKYIFNRDNFSYTFHPFLTDIF